jgi:hypothetical protein
MQDGRKLMKRVICGQVEIRSDLLTIISSVEKVFLKLYCKKDGNRIK